MPLGARLIRVLTCSFLFFLCCFLIPQAGWFFFGRQCLAMEGMMGQAPNDIVVDPAQINPKVNVELFVMSKCPDGEYGEATIADVMEKVGHKVALNFTYIADLYNTSGRVQVDCMHGPSECLGNRQQLCFQKYHPKKLLKFITCLNRIPSQIGESLSYTLHCANKAGVNDYTTVIQPCAESMEGRNMLIACAERCDALKTHTSATIRIAGRNVCKRDGEEWVDCQEVLSQGGGNVAHGLQVIIEKEWRKLASKGLLWQVAAGRLN